MVFEDGYPLQETLFITRHKKVWKHPRKEDEPDKVVIKRELIVYNGKAIQYKNYPEECESRYNGSYAIHFKHPRCFNLSHRQI